MQSSATLRVGGGSRHGQGKTHAGHGPFAAVVISFGGKKRIYQTGGGRRSAREGNQRAYLAFMPLNARGQQGPTKEETLFVQHDRASRFGLGNSFAPGLLQGFNGLPGFLDTIEIRDARNL